MTVSMLGPLHGPFNISVDGQIPTTIMPDVKQSNSKSPSQKGRNFADHMRSRERTLQASILVFADDVVQRKPVFTSSTLYGSNHSGQSSLYH